MGSGTKFYIYGGGRWREVDLSEGRVEGWGRARFAYPRRGKVHVANTRAVLTALKDLAAGRKSAVKDSDHLPVKMCRPNKTSLQVLPKVSAATQCVPRMDAGIQTSQTLTFPGLLNDKTLQKQRQRKTTSTEDNVPIQITTSATVHTSTVHSKTPKKQITSNKAAIAVSSDENSTKKRVPRLKLDKVDLKKYNLYKRRRSKSSDSDVWVVLPKDKQIKRGSTSKNMEQLMSKSKQASRKRPRESTGSSDASLQRSNKKQASPVQIKRKLRNSHEIQKAVTQISVTSSDEQHMPLSALNSRPDTSKVPKTPIRQDQCKELIIDESDVEVLRNYLKNKVPNFDLLKFDQDDAYKKHFFFKINPLVNVERCPKIARMLRRDSQDEMSLKDFASQLGLKSVSERDLLPKRYRMRKLESRKQYLAGNSTHSDTDEGNTDQYAKKDVIRSDKSVTKSHRKGDANIKTKRSNLNTLDLTKLSDDDSDADLKSANEMNRRVLNKKYNSRSKNKNVSDSSEVDSEVDTSKPSRKINTRGQNKVNNTKTIDITSSHNSDSEAEGLKRHVSNRRGQNKVNSNKKYVKLTDSSGSEVEDSRPSNEVKIKNTRSQNKENKNQKTSNEDDSEVETTKPSTEVSRRRENTKRTTYKKTDSETEHPTGKDTDSRTLRHQKKEISKRHENKKQTDSSDDSEVGDSRPSKEINKKRQNNISSKSDRKLINSNEIEDSRSSKTKNARGQNKENKRHENKLEDSSENDPETETSEQTKEVKKTNHNINNRKRDATNSKTDRQDLKKKENKRGEIVNEKTYHTSSIKENLKDKKASKKSQNTDNKSKNITTDTLELSSGSEGEAFGKNFKKPNIEEIKSLATTIRRKHSISKQPCISSAREYSNLEDHAIVAWVSVGGRARCVNGNRIWQELQHQYLVLTGTNRTWHSLRNRYLRYILPSLGTLALPPADVARLRAAAATGELKSHKLSARRNSIFGKPTRGALSRRPGISRSPSTEPEPPPKRHKHDNTRKAMPSLPRVLRSSLPHSSTPIEPPRPPLLPPRSPLQPPRSHRSPRYSDITRHFSANRPRDDSTPAASPKKMPTKKQEISTKNLPETKSVTKETEDSDSSAIKQSLRRSLRTKSPDKSPARSTRTRKLFNPGLML